LPSRSFCFHSRFVIRTPSLATSSQYCAVGPREHHCVLAALENRDHQIDATGGDGEHALCALV
jgi:hypothetical protein